MVQIAIAYHSGFGHTEVVAREVAEGVAAEGGKPTLCNVANLDDFMWDVLNGADAIVFGAPVYMGSVSAPFKAFMDATSKVWFSQGWKDKLAAGFVNSGGANGGKETALEAMMMFACQHSMVWVSQGVFPSAYVGSDAKLNSLGSWTGLMTVASNSEVSDTNPAPEHRATARAFGARISLAAKRWRQ